MITLTCRAKLAAAPTLAAGTTAATMAVFDGGGTERQVYLSAGGHEGRRLAMLKAGDEITITGEATPILGDRGAFFGFSVKVSTIKEHAPWAGAK